MYDSVDAVLHIRKAPPPIQTDTENIAQTCMHLKSPWIAIHKRVNTGQKRFKNTKKKKQVKKTIWPAEFKMGTSTVRIVPALLILADAAVNERHVPWFVKSGPAGRGLH